MGKKVEHDGYTGEKAVVRAVQFLLDAKVPGNEETLGLGICAYLGPGNNRSSAR